MKTCGQHNDRVTIERAIIGCVLYDDSTLHDLLEIGLDETWFVDGSCRRTIELSLDRISNGKHTDAIVASKILTDIDDDWFDGCIDISVVPSFALEYGHMLRGYEVTSRGEMMGTSLVSRAKHTKPDGADELLAWIDRAAASVSVGNVQPKKTSETIMAEIEAELDDPAKIKFIDWPLECLNKEIGRITNEVIWISALPSLGKTALVTQWGQRLAELGVMSAIASLETPKKNIIWRQISQYGRMNTFHIKQGRGTPRDITKAKEAMRRISPLTIIEDGGKSIEQVKAWARDVHKQGAKIIMIDNTRWITVGGANGRVDGTATISSGMKSIRDELGIPIVVLHHSRIDSNGKEDVSWSADIRRDTDMLLFLRKNEDKTQAIDQYTRYPRLCSELHVDKSRDGPSGMDVHMEFHNDMILFDEWRD